MGFGKAQRRSSVCSLHSPLPSLCLSPDSESTSLLPTGPQSEITHPSAGGIRQERGEGGLDEVWRKTQFQFSVIQTNFQIHSITSCCWFLLWWFWQVYKMRFGSFRPSVFAHDPTTKWVTDSSNPGIQLLNCLFFFSFCDCNKSTFAKRPSWIVCACNFYGYHYCYYFFGPVVVFCLFCLLGADEYLNAKKE